MFGEIHKEWFSNKERNKILQSQLLILVMIDDYNKGEYNNDYDDAYDDDDGDDDDADDMIMMVLSHFESM